MDVVVTGRNCEISDRFRTHAADKLSRLEKHDQRIIRVEVEVEAERNPRQAERAVRVQLTALSKGPVVRAEAAAGDKMGALDLALDKMATQMRRAADRRRMQRRQRTPVGQAFESLPEPTPAPADHDEPVEVDGEGPLVVREKSHRAVPMTLDQALYEMELVGHDFYLYVEKDSGRPAVLYRRRGYNYGVISLDLEE